MGYTHGIQWTEEKIIQKIKEVIEKSNINTMPSFSLIKEIMGDSALCTAISRAGGVLYFSKKMGLELGKCESFYARKFEEMCCEEIKNKLGYKCNTMKVGYPYDILCEEIKIDVKVSHLTKVTGGNSFAYTCNLEKTNPTCDIFICYCVDSNDNIVKTYIIPSCVICGKTQITFGQFNSKYDCFIDNWELLTKYNEFNKEMKNTSFYLIKEANKVVYAQRQLSKKKKKDNENI